MPPAAAGVQSATAEGGSWRGAVSDDFFKVCGEGYEVRDDEGKICRIFHKIKHKKSVAFPEKFGIMKRKTHYPYP